MWNDITQFISFNEIIQSVAAFSSAVMLLFTFMEVRKISQTNVVTVIAHCANRYDLLMRDLPSSIESGQIDLWWYRLWDLWSEEFYFVRKGVLDKEIFCFWIMELASLYDLPPRNMPIPTTQREAHILYLSNFPPEDKMVKFFNKVSEISENQNPVDRTKAITKLVRKL